MNWVRLIPTILVKWFIKIVYAFLCLFLKVNPHKVTFASYRSETLSGNLYFVHEKFKEMYPEYQFHFVFKRFKGSKLGKLSYVFHMAKVCKSLATSKFFIIDDYYFPVYVIKPRKKTEIIQLWHAAGALKKFGYSTVGKSFGPSPTYLKHVKIHSNYSKAFVSSSEVIPFYAEAFNMPPNQIFSLGIPRTDILLSENHQYKTKSKFNRLYPHSENKKIILYAPTYRGKSHYQEGFRTPFEIDMMKNKLKEEFVLLIHLHPYMKAGEDFINEDHDFIIHIQKDFDIQELLMISDVLITDFSSVMFDFSLLGRPMAFFAKDLEEYIQERDFYYTYENLIPGPLFSETTDLIEWIQCGKYELDKVTEFKNRFFDYNDGKSTERIVHTLLS